MSQAGLVLLRRLADQSGLSGGLSEALASERLLVHDRGRVLADLACAVAGGSEVISDFRVLADQKELFGQVASVPTTWRTLSEIATGGPATLGRISAAVAAARCRAWAAGRGPPRWAGRGADRGQGRGGSDLHPAGRYGHGGALGEGTGGAELQGVRSSPVAVLL